MPKRTRLQPKNGSLQAARAVARAEVQRKWPELADVEPKVTQRKHRLPESSELRQLGLERRRRVPLPNEEYTFTFATEVRTPEGYTMPRVARVTVDSHQRVVKAVVSK